MGSQDSKLIQEQQRIDKLLASDNHNDQLQAAFFIFGCYPYPWWSIKGQLFTWYAKFFAKYFNGWTTREINLHIQRGREFAQLEHDYRELHPSTGT